VSNPECYESRVVVSAETRFHEAGHAVGAIVLDIGLDPEGIIINSNSDAATHVRDLPLNEQTAEWCLRRAAVKLSGGAAEMRIRNQAFHPDTFESDSHYLRDYNEAREVLWKFEAYGSECRPERVDENLNEALVMAHDLIPENWSDVEKVAQTLISKAALSASEICTILAG
jgi:ATP-dependent Zn protease